MDGASALPPWNSAEPAESLWCYAAWFNETARATFLRDGSHLEIYFLVLPDGQIALGQPPPGIDRDHVLATLRQSIAEHDVYGVIQIAESWSYIPKRPDDHTYKQVVSGEITVAQLKPEDRTETLLVRMESRAGAHHIWLSPVVRSADGASLRGPLEFDDAPGGRMGSFFSA